MYKAKVMLSVPVNSGADVAGVSGTSRREKAAAGTPQAHVVLVGINDYADKQIKPRNLPRKMPNPLRSVQRQALPWSGWDHIRLLLGNADEKRHSQPATRANIIKALHDAVAAARAKDLVIFAFIGQGAPLGERTCYLPPIRRSRIGSRTPGGRRHSAGARQAQEKHEFLWVHRCELSRL